MKYKLKISKDALILWCRIIPIAVIIIHGFFVAMLIIANFWMFYLMYAFFFVMHFFVLRVWRLFFVQDVYINTQEHTVIFKNLSDKETRFNMSNITDLSTSGFISKVTTNLSEHKDLYFIANSDYNKDILKPYD